MLASCCEDYTCVEGEFEWDFVLSEGAPNIGMHPTANQRLSYRKLGRTAVVLAAGDAGRYAANDLEWLDRKLNMEDLDCEAARLWSKERIRAEIERRRDELRESEEQIQSQGGDEAQDGSWGGAEAGCWQIGEDYKVRRRGEIDYLLSLL